jgi:hypothetical protein
VRPECQELGQGWQDGDGVRAPRNMMSKQQVRRDLLRKRRMSQGAVNLRKLDFLEDIQENADRVAMMRQVRVK